MATLIQNAAAVKAASTAIDAAIVAKGGSTAGGLTNAAAAIAALPSGGASGVYIESLAGATLTCGSDTYTLGEDETHHFFAKTAGTYACSASKDGLIARSKTVTITSGDIVVEKMLPSRVPDGFQEVEYIFGNGEQSYLDLGVNFLFGDEFYFTFKKVSYIPGENKGYGAGADLSVNLTSGGRNNSHAFSPYLIGSDYSIIPYLPFTVMVKFSEHWKIKGDGSFDYTLTNTETSQVYTLESPPVFPSGYDSQATVYLFKDNSGWSFPSCQFLYYSKLIRQNGTIVRETIPCYRISDSKVGVYDTPTGNFLTTSTYVDFIAGPNV